jgi:hypothetical protein
VINGELAAIWDALVKTHYKGQIHILQDSSVPPLLNIESFHRGLMENIRKAVTHDRYTHAWVLANNAIPPPYLPTQATIDWRARNEARMNARDARRQKQKQTDQGDKGNVEEEDGQRPSN